jgi:hypothetical protein
MRKKKKEKQEEKRPVCAGMPPSRVFILYCKMLMNSFLART